MDTAEPRLLLKVTPPRISRRMLERTALGLDVPQLADRPIIRLEAPAGFGKTSLLGQWRRALLAAGTVVVWLNADADDDPARFAQALAFAMERACGRPAFGRLGQGQVPGTGEFDRLTAWLAEVANAGAESVLVIDEADALPADTLRSVDYILHNLPSNLRVILAGRRRLRLHVTDLTARGNVAQLGGDALRFSLAETLAAVRMHLGERVNPDAVARMHELTQGWPLGLSLAISAVERGSDARALIDGAAHTGKFGQYFFESLLERLSPDRADFLTGICVTDRIHPQLCTVLTGRSDAAALLEELRETTPILAGQDGEWATLHPMARDFLRAAFAQWPAARRKAAHVAASQWLAEHHLEEEAARHALKAGQKARAWELAEKTLFDVLLRGEVGRVREWFERTPLPEREQRPRLLLAAGWSYALSARHEQAAALARRVLEDRRASEEERLHARLMVSAAAIYADRVVEAEALIGQWSELVNMESVVYEPNGVNQLAWLVLQRGHPAECRRILQRTGSSGEGSKLVGGYHAAVEALSHLWEGQMGLAAQVLAHGLARAEQSAGRRDAMPATLAGLLALALCEQGEAQQAELVLANRLDAIEYLAAPAAMITGYVAAARLAVLRGQEDRAFELLTELCDAGESRAMLRVQAGALGEMIRLHALRGRGETCAELLAQLDAALGAGGPIMAGAVGEVLRLAGAIATAYAQGARGEWVSALATLDAAAAGATRLRRSGDAVEIRLLRARALQALGREYGFVLNEAVGLAGTFGLRRMIEESPIDELRRSAQPPGRIEPLPVTPGVVVLRPGQEPEVLSLQVAPTPLLTPKERDILGLLVHRLSNKQIANVLDVGDATIKWHLKNVFSKLHAGSRDHAVQRARMLGIIEV